MKKYIRILLLILVVCISCVAFSACNNKNKPSELTTYDIVATLDLGSNKLLGYQEVVYQNNTGDTLDVLKFHLYPNAYREGAAYPAISKEHHSAAYYNGTSYGGIEVTFVKQNGIEIPYEISGLDNDILTVKLSKPMSKLDKVNLQMEYTVSIPKTHTRFGVTKSGVNLANFYPLLCVYENGDFVTSPYYAIGDPFYSDTSNYYVELNVNGNGLVASSGNLIESFNKNDKSTHIIDAEHVRDFALVYLKNGQMISERVDDTDVKYFYSADIDAAKSLSYALKCFTIFNNIFGKYPYKTYSVVDTNFIYGGMEYPNLSMINSFATGLSREYVIAHETAHQWWYGVVGTNSVANAWIDEGLAEFSTALYFKHSNREALYHDIVESSHCNYINVAERLAKQSSFDGIMTKRLDEFPSEGAYIATVYDKAMMMNASMYELMGERAYLVALQTFYKENSHKNATPNSFLNCFSKPHQRLFEIWLNGEVLIPPLF
ncbi:MAG: M1 family metallopeptidase [Clostridia bacterium]